jgi:hypothetical protein
MNKHISETQVSFNISGRYYHDPKQAAMAWASCVSRTVHNRKPYPTKDGCFVNTDDIQKFWDHQKLLYKKAYRRAFPLFKASVNKTKNMNQRKQY